MLNIVIKGSGIARFDQAAKALGEGKARRAYATAINHTGNIARTQAGRALSDQTGLSKTVGRKAMRRYDRASAANLTYTVNTQGGEIRVKFFRPRETRKGVTASPWNKRTLFASTFMRAGWWPSRVDKPNWNRQVFVRTGTSKATRLHPGGMDQFEVKKSDVIIPDEVQIGQTARAWEDAGRTRLQPRIEHQIRRITKGVVT